MMTMPKKRALKILLCSLVCNFMFIHEAQNVAVTLHEPLAIALQATGAELSRVHVAGSAKITKNGAAEESLSEMVSTAADALGISKKGRVVEATASDYQKSASLSSHTEKEKILISAKQLNNTNGVKPSIAFTVKVWVNGQEETAFADARKRIFAAFEKIGGAPRISTCLEGYLDGKLENSEWTVRLRDAFDAVGARLHSKIENERYASYAGFSPLIQERSIKANGKEINVNMAMRYHAFDQRTYVIVASPAITMEY